MNHIALTRLLVANNRSTRRRLAGIIAGVMAEVTLFPMLLATAQAFPERSMYSSQTFTALVPDIPGQSNRADLRLDHTLIADELAVTSNSDVVGNQTITVLGVVLPKSGATSVKIPGSDIVPKPGEYLVSPVLAKRTASLPTNQLGDRYGKQVGVLPLEVVEGSDLLVAIVGMGLGTVSAFDFHIPPQVVTSFQGILYENEAYRIAAIVGTVAMLMPVLLFVRVITDLGAVRRVERFTTLRLIGVTPQQTARTAALEIGTITFVGVPADMVLYLVLIPLAAQIALKSSCFYYSDLLCSSVNAVLTVVVTAAGAAVVAWWCTRRTDLGPLGGSRERVGRRPRLIPLAPVILGTVGLVSTPTVAHQSSNLTICPLPVSFLCTILGLLWAGPVPIWQVARGGRALVHSTAQVIGFNRVTQHPRTVFRAVAGVVVAICTMTVFAVAITAAAGTCDITQDGGYLSPTSFEATLAVSDEGALNSAVDQLAAVPGVTAVTMGRISRGGKQDSRVILETGKVEALGAPRVESPDGMMSISTRWLYENTAASLSPVSAEEPVSAREYGTSIVLVDTNPASPGAVGRVCTAPVTSGLVLRTIPTLSNSIQTFRDTAMENQLTQLGYIGALIAVGIPAVLLKVSAVTALLGRWRVLGLLRLAGMPAAALCSMVSYETMLLVVTTLVTSIGLGQLTAQALVDEVSGRHIS